MSPRTVRVLRVVTFAALLAGLAVRVLAFAGAGSLWLDEIAVARNILERSTVDLLTRPLDYWQSAPKGFLAVEKLATIAFGSGDYVLRLWPFLASLAGLVLLWRLATRVLTPIGGCVAVTCAAFAVSLIRQTAELKQYGTDVFVALLLTEFALATADDRRFDVVAALVGAVAIWLSQPAAIVAGCMVLMLAWRYRARRFAPAIYRCGLWTVSAGAAALVAIRALTPETNDYMHRYWAAGFPPAHWSEIVSTAWPWAPLVQLFSNGDRGFSTSLGYPWPELYAALALAGLALLVWRRRSVGLFVALPLVATVIAALVRQYPFRDRVILFLVPAFFVGLGEFAAVAYGTLARLRRELGALAVAALVAGAVLPIVRVPPPYPYEDVHPIMSRLAQDRPNGTPLFLHYNAAVPFDYYAARYGFTPNEYLVAPCRVTNPAEMLREIDVLRGRRRAWIVFVHITSRLTLERSDLLRYLDAIGTRIDAVVVRGRVPVGDPLPSEAFLYDLSDAARLGQADADSFRLQSSFDRGANCLEGPQTMSTGRHARVRLSTN